MSHPEPSSRPTRGAPGGREAAFAVLGEVLHNGRSLTNAVAGRLDDPRERALARELASGVVRHLPSLRYVLAGLLDHPRRRLEARLETALLLGLYQVLYTRVPSPCGGA